MDYLRTLGSAAVSTLVQKSGLNLPFSLGSKHSQVEGYYSLYDATKRVCFLQPHPPISNEIGSRMTEVLSRYLSMI